MHSQSAILIPIPIIKNIISYCDCKGQNGFRQTCKLLMKFVDKYYFPTIGTTLIGSESGYKEGKGTNSQLRNPYFGCVDSTSKFLYFCDMGNHVIRKLELSTNEVTLLSGVPMSLGDSDGMANESHFFDPTGIALNEEEKLLYVSDSGNCSIRSVSLVDGTTDTLCGSFEKRGRMDGIGKNAAFRNPRGLVFDSASKYLYVADGDNHSIRRVSVKDGRVETLCGYGRYGGYLDGSFQETMFHFPIGLALNSSTEELYVSDSGNHVIRVVSLKNRRVSTLCGTPQQEGYEDGPHNQAKFWNLRGISLDTNTNQILYAVDDSHGVRKISLLGEVTVSTLCGDPNATTSRDGLHPNFYYPIGIVKDPNSQVLYVLENENRVRKVIGESRFPAEHKKFLENVLEDAFAFSEHAGRQKVSAMDIVNALRKHGKKLIQK